MSNIGERIKKIRLEKGLSLEDVHKKTKIHMNILKAIEEDSLVNFSPIYIKGFLKIYCNFLGVDVKDFVSDYKENRPVVQVPQPEANPQVSLKNPDASFDFSKILSKAKTAALILAVLFLTILVFRLGKFVFSKVGSLLPKHKQTAVLVNPKQERKNIALPAQKTREQIQTPKVKALPALSDIRLGIRAKDDCWMQVKIDSKTIFQNILKRGRFESWKAKDKIELSLGNAGVVELEVNGKLISTLGRRGQALKNIVITKDGLSTSR